MVRVFVGYYGHRDGKPVGVSVNERTAGSVVPVIYLPSVSGEEDAVRGRRADWEIASVMPVSNCV